jgi:hypothetical protein
LFEKLNLPGIVREAKFATFNTFENQNNIIIPEVNSGMFAAIDDVIKVYLKTGDECLKRLVQLNVNEKETQAADIIQAIRQSANKLLPTQNI